MTYEEIIAIVKKPRNDELYHTKSFIQIEEIPYTECPGAEEYNTCFRITYPYFPDSVHLFLRDAAGNTFLGDEQGLIYLTMTDGGTLLKYCEENGVEPSDKDRVDIVYKFRGFDIDGEEIVVYPFYPDEFDRVFLEGWIGCVCEFGNTIDKKGCRAFKEEVKEQDQ